MEKKFLTSLKNRVTRRFKQTNIGNIIAFILFLLFSFTMVYALVWAFGSSLKDPIEYMRSKQSIFPQAWKFSNYIDAFKLFEHNGTNLIGMFGNSIWLTLGQSAISMAVCTTTAYIMSKYKFVGRRVIEVIILVSMMIPLYGSFSTTFKLYKTLGFYNSPLILLASASGIGSMYYILKSFFQGVSWEYAEAAKIDGANELSIYLRIMLPIAWPAISSIFIVMLINGWNDYTTPVYYLPKFTTVAAGLYYYKTTAELNLQYPVYFAGVLMSCIPTLIMFLVFQEKIMNSITMGGLKE